jgi:hypothetical protein
MTVGHVKVSELTSIERKGPKLHDTWQRVDERTTPYITLKLQDIRSVRKREYCMLERDREGPGFFVV